MTAAPALPLTPPLTADEYAAMHEDAEVRYELQEGNLVMAARPIPRHQKCLFLLGSQVGPQVPGHLTMLLEVDIDLQLAPPRQPGTVRAPDLVVVTRAAFERVDRMGGLLRAADVVLAVEILSTGSRRTDSVIKHREYADAGIGHYWMVDLPCGPSLTACHLAGEFGYSNDPQVTRTFAAEFPFPTSVDLDALA